MSEDVKELVTRAILMLGSEDKLALAAGVTQSTVWRAKTSGKCSPRLAAGIHQATNGEAPKWKLCPRVYSETDVTVKDRPRISINAVGADQFAVELAGVVSWSDAVAISEILMKYQR